MTNINLHETLKNSLKLCSSATITQEIYKKLLENVFSTLVESKEVHNPSTLYNSKPDVLKSVYASLLTITAEFARHNYELEDITKCLTTECGFTNERAALLVGSYDKNKAKLQVILGNIGSHLPHLVDAKWKIDYIVKSSHSDQSEGPLFRISLVANSFDEENGEPKSENLSFSCNAQELQDLVYKLKDAMRHCQRIAAKS